MPRRASIYAGCEGFAGPTTELNTVTITPDFHVVIPSAICEALRLKAGDKLRVSGRAGRLELIPIRPMREMRGFLRGMDAGIERE